MDENLRKLVVLCRAQANVLEQQAREWRRTADQIENPPEGVTVEYTGRGVMFVGPPLA